MNKSEKYQKMADGTLEWVAAKAFIDDEMTQEERENLHMDWVLEVAIAKRFGENPNPRKEKVLRYLEQVKGIYTAKRNGEPQSEPLPDGKQENAERQAVVFPKELLTEQAMVYWERAKKAGFVNEDYSFNGTKYQMAYFAEKFSMKLGLKNKWRPFIELWHFKYFAQTRRESIERIGYVARQNEIDQIFVD